MKNIWLIATTTLSLILTTCKAPSAKSGSRLRNETVIEVPIQLQITNQRLGYRLMMPNYRIVNIAASFQEKQVDNANFNSSTNTVTIDQQLHLHVKASIVAGSVTMPCEAKEVPLSASVMQATLRCTSGSSNDPSTTQEYPPEITTPEAQAMFANLTKECRATTGNMIITPENKDKMVYGCYCAAAKKQILFASFNANTAATFKTQCATAPVDAKGTLLFELQSACYKNNSVMAQPDIDTKCHCPSTDASKWIEFKEYFGYLNPVQTFEANKKEHCGI